MRIRTAPMDTNQRIEVYNAFKSAVYADSLGELSDAESHLVELGTQRNCLISSNS